jgi:hypothetical protein
MPNRLTRAEVLDILRPWHERTVELQRQWDAFEALTGGDPYHPFGTAVWGIHEAYTKTIAAQVGDEGGWLSWWHYECGLGATPKEAYRALGTKALRVSTLERLATVICWGRGA